MQLSWLDETLAELAAADHVGYLPSSSAAAEPTAIAALALQAHGRTDEALQTAKMLIPLQEPAGNVGVRSGETPSWPTSLAVVAWSAILKAQPAAHDFQIDKAVAWLLANRGVSIKRSADFGHNSELVGWAYAEQTHSWVEPTALAVLALQAAGRGAEPAAREGIALLLDRQLPGGGLNYGNTFVLGQLIRPHLQPTGLALLALAAEPHTASQAAKSLAWLRQALSPKTTPTSLAWSLLGLQAQGVQLPEAADWLANAAARVRRTDRSPHKLALLALAQKGWPR